METKNTSSSSSGSVLEEPEIQKLQMQAKNVQRQLLEQLMRLKNHPLQLLEKENILYQQAFAQLFGDMSVPQDLVQEVSIIGLQVQEMKQSSGIVSDRRD
ncbi:hypothetical protein Tco_0053846 [Tanacetum coccineum]